jgi:hypothetical protein
VRLLDWIRKPEVIGPPGCPLMRRWTIFVEFEGAGEEAVLFRRWHFFGYKLLVHHFLPNTEDVDPHDHPRALWTLILKGGYLDLVPCSDCDGKGVRVDKIILGDPGLPDIEVGELNVCATCDGRKLVVGDRMTRGVFRHRPAEHRHVTKVSSAGAWTLCLMGPKEREWGFWRNGKLFDWRAYEHKFGLGFRCESGNRVVEIHRPDGDDAEEPVMRPCQSCGLLIPISQLVDRGDGRPVCPTCDRKGAAAAAVVVHKHAPVGASSLTPSMIAAARRAQQEG